MCPASNPCAKTRPAPSLRLAGLAAMHRAVLRAQHVTQTIHPSGALAADGLGCAFVQVAANNTGSRKLRSKTKPLRGRAGRWNVARHRVAERARSAGGRGFREKRAQVGALCAGDHCAHGSVPGGVEPPVDEGSGRWPGRACTVRLHSRAVFIFVEG